MSHPTQAEQDMWTAKTHELLTKAQELRIARIRMVTEAYNEFGSEGTLISGVEREHWPPTVKDRLRANAREIGNLVEQARTAWRLAGRTDRKFVTYIAPIYRVEGCRY